MQVTAERSFEKIISGQSQITPHGFIMGMGRIIDNMDDITNGNFDIPADTCGITVTEQEYDTLTFEGHDYSRVKSQYVTMYVKEDSFYSAERVKNEFGENSNIYKKMTDQNTEFLIQLPKDQYSQEDCFSNMAGYAKEIVVLSGTDRQYKEIGRYKEQENRVSVDLKLEMN